MSFDALFGKVFSSGSGVELGGGLNFTSGLQAVYNPSTKQIDVTATGGGGGGGGGHTIQEEGVSLTQRTVMNFTGAGVTVTDAGGKTVVTIPGGTGDVEGPASAVSGRIATFSGTTGKLIADSGFATTAVAPGAFSVSGVAAAAGSASTFARSDHVHSLTGTLPVANGGTGLAALGSALQAIRVNAGGTALEFYTVSAGVTAGNGLTGTTTFAVLPENATIAVSASGIKRAAISGDVTIADGSNVAAITAGAVVDADVNASAAIAGTKISPNFGGQDVTTTGNLLAGATPRAAAGSGLRTPSAWAWNARNVANLADLPVVSVGVAATDTIAVGDTTVLVECTEVASGRNVVALCRKSAITTTQLPGNTGDGIVAVCDAATEPTTGVPSACTIVWNSSTLGLRSKGPSGAFKDIASSGVMNERHYEGTVTTTATSLTTVLDIDTSGFGADVSGIAEVTMTARGVAGTSGIAQTQAFSFSRTGGTLDAPGTLTLNGGATTDGTLSATNSSANLRLRVTPAAATKRRWDVHVKLRFSNTDAV